MVISHKRLSTYPYLTPVDVYVLRFFQRVRTGKEAAEDASVYSDDRGRSNIYIYITRLRRKCFLRMAGYQTENGRKMNTYETTLLGNAALVAHDVALERFEQLRPRRKAR